MNRLRRIEIIIRDLGIVRALLVSAAIGGLVGCVFMAADGVRRVDRAVDGIKSIRIEVSP